jgi:outer membrane protein OmpA-like peptidoglycan-associated protein
VSTSAATLDWLLRRCPTDSAIDRKALASLLQELARNVEPELRVVTTGISPLDPRLEQLRTLLLGREIEALDRLGKVVEDPEQFALAIGRVLHAAIANASTDERLGQVLAPTLEKATQSSIRKDPGTLVNILYPLIVPAIRKSIGETVDDTFQSLNETLKHSLTWRGLRWRWEALRTGRSFAEVVLKHTLVYQVEHVFLIHGHTGLLIAHVAAEDAASQDPQLVSSMLSAIQDFVRDSFSGAGQQGLDTLQLGELRLWSEPGPFATLVAVIRGNPPEALHDRLRAVLARIHTERPRALENFDGDSAGFGDVEAQLRECVALRQKAQPATRTGFPWMVAAVGLLLVLAVALWGLFSWQDRRQWDSYVSQLRTQPGIVITETARRDGKFLIAGLRDPLAADPERLLRGSRIDPKRVLARWAPYQALDPELVLKRLRVQLNPPTSISLAVVGDRIVARGTATSTWLARAHGAGRLLPVGTPELDLSAVQDVNDGPLSSLRESIESREIHFDYNEPLPSSGEDVTLDQVARELKELAILASNLGVSTRVTLTGHSDGVGRGTLNLSLSLARAEAVRALLKKRGVNPDLLAVRGAGQLEPLEVEASDAARSVNRRVSFTVGIEEQP